MIKNKMYKIFILLCAFFYFFNLHIVLLFFLGISGIFVPVVIFLKFLSLFDKISISFNQVNIDILKLFERIKNDDPYVWIFNISVIICSCCFIWFRSNPISGLYMFFGGFFTPFVLDLLFYITKRILVKMSNINRYCPRFLLLMLMILLAFCTGEFMDFIFRITQNSDEHGFILIAFGGYIYTQASSIRHNG